MVERRRAGLGLAPGQEYAWSTPPRFTPPSNGQPRSLRNWLSPWSRKWAKPVFSCGPGERGVLDAVQAASSSAIRRSRASAWAACRSLIGSAPVCWERQRTRAYRCGACRARPGRHFRILQFDHLGAVASRASNPPAQVVQNFYECNPCPGDRCYRFERPECILSVTLEQAKSAVKTVLARSAVKS